MKKALIYGINAYPSAPLRGCINDLIDYQNTLSAKGFSCIALTDGMATKARILSELNTLVNGYRQGDVLVVAGSSHGSYAGDQNADEPDRRDELIVPFDWPNQYIRDDELRAIFSRLPAGAICDVFMDCCYSGTNTRLADLRPHRIPVIGNRYVPFPTKVKVRKPKAVIVPTMKENLFAASRDNQTSAEVLVGGVPRGVFSYYVCKAIRTYPNYTRDQIVNYAKTKIAAIGITQTPQLECQAAAAGRLPFS